jgi:hypothetical protein
MYYSNYLENLNKNFKIIKQSCIIIKVNEKNLITGLATPCKAAGIVMIF